MSRSLPYAFTEQGIYMLMTVLRGDLAVRQSKALIRLFKSMKDLVVENQDLVGQREFLQLSMRVSDSISETLKLRRELSDVEQDVAEIIDEMGDFVRESDINSIMEQFGKATERYGYLILDGQPIEAAAAYAGIYRLAHKSVFVVDNYVDVRTLEMIAGVRDGVSVTLFTDNKGRRLRVSEVSAFRGEYPNVDLEIRNAGGFVHDRLIAIDYGTPDEAVYYCGASSKDAGKHATIIMRTGNPETFHALFDRLLEQPLLSME